MKITLIGSNGLLSTSIGSYCNLNRISLSVWGLSSPELHKCDEFYKINLLKQDIDIDKLLDSDIIIYTSGAGIQSNLKEPFADVYYLNAFLPIKLYKELGFRDFKGIVITFGSYFEYGSNAKQKPLDETDIISSLNPVPNEYSISKRLLTRFIVSDNPSFINWHFILPTIYGENESPQRLLPYIVNSIKNNTDIKLTTGEQVRQYLYIDEIPVLIYTAYENRLVSGIYNVAGSESYSIKKLTKHVFSFFNKPLNEEIFGGIEKADIKMKNLQLDGTKLFQITHFKAKILVADVLQKYYDNVYSG
jgi:nucleoside-diphosphate-sugar epimerase